MALLATRTLDAGTGQKSASGANEKKSAHLFVMNDASFIQNANFNSMNNRDFVLNAANYLTENPEVMSIRPAEQIVPTLELSKGQLVAVFAFSVVLTPLLIAGLGAWVWWRRK